MHVAGIKSWFHHIHAPRRRDIVLRTNNIMHDKHFLAILALAVLTALIVGFGIWTSMTAEPLDEMFFSPYRY